VAAESYSKQCSFSLGSSTGYRRGEMPHSLCSLEPTALHGSTHTRTCGSPSDAWEMPAPPPLAARLPCLAMTAAAVLVVVVAATVAVVVVAAVVVAVAVQCGLICACHDAAVEVVFAAAAAVVVVVVVVVVEAAAAVAAAAAAAVFVAAAVARLQHVLGSCAFACPLRLADAVAVAAHLDLPCAWTYSPRFVIGV